MSWTCAWTAKAADILSTESGLTFSSARRPYAEAAMRRAMAKAHFRDPGQYVAQLKTRSSLLGTLVDEVIVGETYFFRDPAQFEAIRTAILPEVFSRRSGREVRVWSAGCASGEEAYSLAIVLEELGVHEATTIVATDVSLAAIETARKGIYGAWSFRGTEPSRYLHCLQPRNGKWSVAPRLRDRIEFAVQNLARPQGTLLGEFDLILCRNVLMYFDQATAARVGSFLAQSLARGGWLIISPADPMLVGQTGLEQVTTTAGIFYRRAQPTPAFLATAPIPKLADYPGFEPAPVDLFQPEAPMRVQSPEAPMRVQSPEAPMRVQSPEAPMRVQSPEAPMRVQSPEATMRVQSPEATMLVQSPAPEGAREQTFHETATAAGVDALDPQFHVLQALRLLDMNSPAAAAASARRALFLNRSVAMAHFALARSLRLLGWHEVARRALRRARAVAGEESQGVQGLDASIEAELLLLDRSATK
jgi:chemotaxis protein methyltransferase CheR